MNAWPLDIRLHQASGRLEVLWSDGARASLSGALLRGACRCAGCQERRRQQQPVHDTADAAVADLRPVGDMGLQIIFSDGHDRGIFPWPYLHQLSSSAP
ncbi:MAG TPA: gamma-butyrobetaine hydroxylase-like domain-containing protein [Ramlibacter sp.]|nr:gamma-butyrobetaine hydroxylase-like domain-containing protein [Ramlibacter sp.]